MKLSREEMEVIMELLYDERHRLDDGIFDWENGTPAQLKRIVESARRKIRDEWEQCRAVRVAEFQTSIMYEE